MPDEETQILLRQEEARLIAIIEAFAGLSQSKEWLVLKELIFDKALKAIERQLLAESLSPQVKIEKIYKLQGKREWAQQYCEVERFVENLKRQLAEIKRKLK